MMYDKLNEMQFLHKIKTAKLTKSVLKIADENDVTESDICIMAGMLYCMRGKTDAEITKLFVETLLFNKVELKRMKNSDSYEIERIKYISRYFFNTFSTTRLSQAFNLSLNSIDCTNIIAYNKFMLTFLKENYSGDDDEMFIEEFINMCESGDYPNAVRQYFLTLILGRFKLSEKLAHIYLRSYSKSFTYAINQEIIYIVNLLVRYGRNNKMDIISEEMMDICNEAINEINGRLADQQYEHILQTIEMSGKITELNNIIDELKATIEELNDKLSEYENLKILSDKNVLVISDDAHKEGYREIIEKHGGNFEFACGVDSNVKLIINRAMSNDIVFFCTAYTKHKLFYAGLKDLDNIKYVPSIGLDSLEREVLKLKY